MTGIDKQVLYYSDSMKTHTRIGISIPKEMLADIDKLRKMINRSRFIVELVKEPLKKFKEGRILW